MDEEEPLMEEVAPPKSIVIIGAGAAGMSCAATLAQHPDKFKVTVIERAEVCGGQATSIPLDKSKHGADWINGGVQGGSPIFKHSFHFFEQYGYKPEEVKLQVSFGKGPEGFWSNCFPSKLVERYSSDIKKFGRVLRIIKWSRPILGIIPIRIILKMFFFSKDFGDKMVYPLIALFLGTGNQTANVSCAILERLFDDPKMKLWHYSPDTLLPNLPTMVTFPNLHNFYEDWREDLISKGVDIRLGLNVTAVLRRDKHGVTIQTCPVNAEAPEYPRETFDDLVLCVLADEALKILGKNATWREKFVLSGAKFFDDVTITHTDFEYFQKHYETNFKPELCAEPKSRAQEEQIAFAKGHLPGPDGEPPGFRPMYYTKTYGSDPQKVEMSFDCTNYQHQFREDSPSGVCPVPYEDHVFQTIFLDRTNADLWTVDEIDPSKIIARKWWHQLGHRWQHYLRVVPGMMWINGRKKTFFAGSWTLLNTHEMACVSGIAAAYRLGAEYVDFDDFAGRLFGKYLLVSHGMVRSAEEARRKKLGVEVEYLKCLSRMS